MAVTNNKQKSIVAVLVVAVVVVIVLAAVPKSVTTVPVVTVTRADVSQTISTNGKVEPIDPFTARAEFPAFVSKVAAIEGQPVHRGQLILTLDASDIQSQLAQVQADLITAQTSLRNARAGGAPAELAQLQSQLTAAKADVTADENQQKHLETLLSEQAVTQDEVDKNATALAKAQALLKSLDTRQSAMKEDASSNAEQADLRVHQDQDEITSLQGKVRSATVVSPIDGTLYELPVHVSDYVKVGDELAEIADLHKVRVRVFVDEPDMGMLAPNETVQVSWDALPGHVWTGKTEQVPVEAVPHGTNNILRSVGEQLCSVDNNNNNAELLPNVNVDVKIFVHQAKNALVVPRGAVKDDNGQRYVFVFADGQVKRRNVTLGISNASDYQVLSGLSENERVAVPQDGARALHDGMDVRPAEAS